MMTIFSQLFQSWLMLFKPLGRNHISHGNLEELRAEL
jgi:hypothetical protein